MSDDAAAAGGASTSGNSLSERLARASAGLVFSSESDRPFELFHRPAAVVPRPLTPAAFAALVHEPPDAPVEERSVDGFFARHIELVDPADALGQERLPRYDALKRLLLAELSDVRVFRIGRVQVRCFVVGRAAAGDLIGLETVAIET